MRALISVFDKTGLVDFARSLHELGIEIVATGGTAKKLTQANIPIESVSAITKFPEIMDGRVKTLHPKIMGGILGRRDRHQTEAQFHQIPWFDLVVCNLYPFASVIKDKTASFETIVENIDIGGPTMIRAAAKNHAWITVVVDPSDYQAIVEELRQTKTISLTKRKELAAQAFAYTAQYDSIIANYLQHTSFPMQLTFPLTKIADLRYGENPHQEASVYKYSGFDEGVFNSKQHQGKQLSFNNLFDADAALNCAAEFNKPACVVVKHAIPCGVAEARTIDAAFTDAWMADSKSAFGGVIALNAECTAAIAEKLKQVFTEVIVAPSYTEEALKILRSKSNLRVLEVAQANFNLSGKLKYMFKSLTGGVLMQSINNHQLSANQLQCVTKKTLGSDEVEQLLFAWRVVKYAKSNAVVIARTNESGALVTLGIGQGQVSRVDAMECALRKANNDLNGAVLASDGFFPFRDNIDLLANTGISAIIQPGGSIRDSEVIAACDELGIAMVFTGMRNFNH